MPAESSTAREELAKTIADYLAFHGPRTIDPADMAYQLTVSIGLLGLERVAALLRDAGYDVHFAVCDWEGWSPVGTPENHDALLVEAPDAG